MTFQLYSTYKFSSISYIILTLFIYASTVLTVDVTYADAIDELQSFQTSSSKKDRPLQKPTVQNSVAEEQGAGAISPVQMVDGSMPKNKDVKFEYRIGTNDVLEIEVFQVEDLKHTSRVNTRGYISVPLLGAVKVDGLTVDEAERFITAAYAKDLLQNPHVSIFVKEYESQKYTVEGEVKGPGVFPLKGPTTLLQAIAMAKGMEKLADYEAVVIFRTNAKQQVIGYVTDLEKIRGGELEDPFIATNDIVVVPRSGDKAWIEQISSTLRGFIGFGNPLSY